MIKKRELFSKELLQPEQPSLFENIESIPEKVPTVLDFIKARYEYGPEMTPEEYKRWIKILVNSSIKRLK